MPTPTYVALAKTVLTGSQTTITFSAIPQTYTDLLIVVSARLGVSGTNATTFIRPNASTTNASSRELAAYNGTNTYSGSYTSFPLTAPGSLATANTFSSAEIYFPNYTASTNKVISYTGVMEDNNASTNYMHAIAGLWSNTAAITSIDIFYSNNFVSGSRFDLYGIKNS